MTWMIVLGVVMFFGSSFGAFNPQLTQEEQDDEDWECSEMNKEGMNYKE